MRFVEVQVDDVQVVQNFGLQRLLGAGGARLYASTLRTGNRPGMKVSAARVTRQDLDGLASGQTGFVLSGWILSQ